MTMLEESRQPVPTSEDMRFDPEVDDDVEDDLDEEPDHGDLIDVGIDDLFGPWLGDEDLADGGGWPTTVPDRGYYRD